MKKPLLFCIPLMLFCLTIAFFINNAVKRQNTDRYDKTALPGEFLKEWMAQTKVNGKTLVLLDLDDTVFSTLPDKIIRPDIFYNLKQEEINKYPQLPVKVVEARIKPLLFHVFSTLPYQLTDNLLPQVIKKLKSEGVSVFGLTARGEEMMPRTLELLKQFDIQFSSIPNEQIISEKLNYPLIAQDGVFFVASNKKGDVVNILLDLGKIKKPEQILFMDDRYEHVKNVAESIAAYDNKIKFFPVFCTYPSKFKCYDEESTKNELVRFLTVNKTDAKVKELLETDPYTQELVAERCSPNGGNQSCEIFIAKNNKKFNTEAPILNGNELAKAQ